MSQIKPIVAAVQGIWSNPYLKSIQGLSSADEGHSGVTRLWMYELYEKAIKEDEEKRKQAQLAKPPKKAPAKRPKSPRARPPEQKPVYKPLPVFARIAPPQPSIADIIEDSLSKLPVLSTNIQLPKKIVFKPDESVAKKKRQQEEELLLLLAA